MKQEWRSFLHYICTANGPGTVWALCFLPLPGYSILRKHKPAGYRLLQQTMKPVGAADGSIGQLNKQQAQQATRHKESPPTSGRAAQRFMGELRCRKSRVHHAQGACQQQPVRFPLQTLRGRVCITIACMHGQQARYS